MAARFTVAVDAMGGDRAPEVEVEAAIAVARADRANVVLVGDRETLREHIDRLDGGDVAIEHASECVTMDDAPAVAYRKKRDSSLRIGLELIKAGKADAFVSAGNSGAILVHANMVLRRLAGVERPGIVAMWPTPAGRTVVLCDAGANVIVRPTQLAQFGILGACFEKILLRSEAPRVGILCNGSEAGKGTELTREAHELLSAAAGHADADFDFVGYVEGNTLFRGGVDVVATDGFTGNVVLKVSEGVAEAMLMMVKAQLESSMRAKVGGALAKPALYALRDAIHPSGAPLLGVRGLVMICHGGADVRGIRTAIDASVTYLEKDLINELARGIGRHERLWETL